MRAPSSLYSTAAGPVFAERRVDVVARRREHRLDRASDLRPTARSASTPPVSAAVADVAEVAAEHAAPAGPRRAAPGRAGDRLDHDALLGALAQLAGQQRDEEALLGLGGAGEERGQRRAARRLRARPRHRADRLARRVDLDELERGLHGRRGQLAQRAVAHADLALAQLAGQVGDADGHFVGLIRRRVSARRSIFSCARGVARTASEVAVSSANSMAQSWQASDRAPTRQLMFEAAGFRHRRRFKRAR